MSPEGDTTIAFVLVVDASIPLLSSWANVVVRYLLPIVKRVIDPYPGLPYTFGFITYGTSDTNPSPILCKKFFQEYSLVLKAMREDPVKFFSMGSTTTGGSKGMATLEGLVAAVEMFDTLIKCRDSKIYRTPIFHLVHISASVADDSLHPQWNDLPELDEITWEKLPSELSNRDINFSSIVLNSKNTKCSELHSSISTKVVAPWFPVDPTHSVLLSGFNTIQPSKGTKRPGDTPAMERSPDLKRPRLGSATSPTLPNPTPPANPANPATPVPPSNPPIPPAPPTLSGFLPGTNIPISKLPPPVQARCMQYQMLDEYLKHAPAMIQEATSSGQSPEKITHMKEEILKRVQVHQKLKTMIMQLVAKINQNGGAMMQNAAGSQLQRPPEGTAPPTNQVPGPNQNSPPKPGTSPIPANADLAQRPPPLPSSTSPDVNSSLSNNAAPPPDPQSHHVRSSSNASQTDLSQRGNTPSSNTANPIPGLGPSRMQMSPDVAAQMTKLLEQSERRPFGGPSGSMVPNLNATQTNTNQNFTQPPGATPDAPGPGLVGTNSNPNNVPGAPRPQPVGSQLNTKGPPVWQGIFFLPGDPQTGRREIKVQVAMYANPTTLPMARPDTWPPMMQLHFTRDLIVHNVDFQIWAKATKATICMVQAAPRGGEAGLTDFRFLYELLNSSPTYAAAGWTTPNGTQGNNALFFAVNNTVAAAILPMNGIPEMPKPGLALKIPSLSDAQRQSLMTFYATRNNNSNNPALMNTAARAGVMQGQPLGVMQGTMRPGISPNQLGQQAQQLPHPMAFTNSLLGSSGQKVAVGNVGANGIPARPNMGAGMNFPGQNMMMNNLARQVASPSGVGMGGNGIPSNVSLEMMQSFIQRKAEGNNGAGPGPG